MLLKKIDKIDKIGNLFDRFLQRSGLIVYILIFGNICNI